MSANNNQPVINEELVTKLISVIDAGLCKGLGEPEPGAMCVMAAINYAMGNDHGDQPSCVGYAVRSFDIKLNDAKWSSNKARSAGMRAEAIAKLGSNKLDQSEFAEKLSIQTVKVILPIAMNALLSVLSLNAASNAQHITAITEASSKCSSVVTRKDACEVAQQCKKAADAAAYAAAYAASAAAYAAAYAASAAAYAAAYAASAAASAAAYAASAAAYAAAYAASAAAYAARKNVKYTGPDRDEILTMSSNLAKDILVEMGSEGSKFLYLLDNKE
jgi:hypothetical protein